jgi:hypothetical protein
MLKQKLILTILFTSACLCASAQDTENISYKVEKKAYKRC